jgi:predicted transglutaminase-like cysteine proteinase
MGFVVMCVQNPSECKGGGADTIDATNKVMSTLKQVNATVNKRMQPLADAGVDVWTVNATAGDCEDYVLAKRKELVRSGIPPSSLRIAAVKTRDGIGHAVLVVNTTRGQYVLDNLTAAIRPLPQTGYRVVAMQSADPYVWL